ncbi:methyltransferase type 11 [Clohesyomyces aquaticus]|uniref:Methyltransferase type 11 n=1 Tax=Clohesyomyces aquaticus TaxID=1231657 RepID=A0A1Y1ZDR0_9PLEO|nr:methyltransferase type 11 [Clohesyomyces aquaticus]
MTTSNASTYRQSHDPSVTNTHARRTAEVEGAFVLPRISQNFRILDVGCGPGSITCGFARYVPQGSVTGIDLTEEVLSQARTKLSNLNPKPSNVTFELGNAADGLKYPDDSFDVVFTSQVLIHIPDAVKALKEMKRVCKPGGFVACREADLPFHWHPFLPGIQLWSKYFHSLIFGPTDSAYPMNPPYGPGHRAGVMVHFWARQAGFDPEKMERADEVQVWATKEDRKWFSEGLWGRIEKGGQGEKFRELGASEEDVDMMIKDLKAWADDVDGWHGQIQCQIICRV